MNKPTTVKVSLTTTDGEVLDIFYVYARPFGDGQNVAALSNLLRDKLSDRFNVSDTVPDEGDLADTDR